MAFIMTLSLKNPISPDDLQKIEKEMKKIIDLKSSITKSLTLKKMQSIFLKRRRSHIKESIIQESDQVDNFQLYYQDDEFC